MNRTSFLDCKHKHMMKSGAPPDIWLPTEFHGFTSRINSKGSLFGSWSYLNFLERVWGPLNYILLLALNDKTLDLMYSRNVKRVLNES